jgi:hypothetical protein
MAIQWISAKDLAVELGVPAKKLVQQCREAGLPVQNRVTKLRPEHARTVREWYAEPQAEAGQLPPQAAEIFAAIEAGDGPRLARAVAPVAGRRVINLNGVSALMMALYHRREEMVAVLRSAQGSVDAFEAGALGDVSALTALLDHEPESLHAMSSDGFSLLHLAAFFGRSAAVHALLERGAQVDTCATNGSNLRPVHSAVAGGNIDAVAALLAHGCEVNAAQAGGYTPLHAAAHAGRVDMVKLLLEHGADREAAIDAGDKAVDLAGEAEDVKALLM